MKGVFGCTGFILSVILLVFVLTHLTEIWNWLEGIFT